MKNASQTAQPQATVLVVDDNQANLEVLTSCLKSQGYKTSVARNGRSALERAKRLHPGLILLDVLMPQIDGFEVCRRLKADHALREIPVIFMTSLSDLDDKLTGFDVGAADYITKPFRTPEVLARVSLQLRLQEQARELAQANADISALNQRLEAENIRISNDLLVTEFKYKTLLDEMTDGYCLLQSGRIMFANPMFCRMHDLTREHIVNRAFTDLVAPESRQSVEDIFRQNRPEALHPQRLEYLRQTADGDRPTEMNTRAARHERSVVDIAICRDVSERREMERRVRDAERMAYIGKLTTSLSHEIRNPLSAIKLNLQILKKTGILQNDLLEYLDISIREVMRLEGSLNELLNFARPQRLQYTDCHIHELLRSCVFLFKAESEQKGLKIRHDTAADIPAIQADEKKLTQVFVNILLNAFELSEPGAEIGIVSRVCLDGERRYVEIAVEDEGPGVSEHQMQEIFEAFFTTKTQGTGLGLTNVKQIVEAHHGSVSVENRKPHGAIFRVRLPERQDRETRSYSPSPSRRGAGV